MLYLSSIFHIYVNYEEFFLKLNDFLKQIRKKYKISRREMAELTGLSQRSIESYEYGVNKPSNDYIQSFCAIFGVRQDFLTDNIGLLECTSTINDNQEDWKLTDFAWGLNKFLFFSGLEPHDLYLMSDSIDMDDINLVLSLRINEKFDTMDYISGYPEYNFDERVLFIMTKIIEGINGIKPGSFGYSLSDIAQSVEKGILQKFVILENDGFEITKEGVAEYMKKRITMNEPKIDFMEMLKQYEADKLVKLWKYAPKPVQDKIIATLEKYKQQADELDDL